MKSIEQQIQELTEELRPYPTLNSQFWTFDGRYITERSRFSGSGSDIEEQLFRTSLYASTNKAEVEEYADCYRRLKLYQLLGEKSMRSNPEAIEKRHLWTFYGTDFYHTLDDQGCIYKSRFHEKTLVLGGVWFTREEHRLEALRICGIDRAFQERCAKYGLGGA